MEEFFLDLKKAIEINSYTGNKKGVDKTGALFKEWFESMGFKTETFVREIIGNHLLFKSPKVKGEKILLLGHLDTVFPEGKFETYSDDDTWVYGPGVCDMKGGNLVALQSLRNISQNSPIQNIDMLLVSDEETGSDDSKFITKDLAKEYDICLVFEAAGENLEVVTGRKGVGTFFIDITGKAAHSGVRYAEGINANLEASIKLQKLTELTNLNEGTTVNVGKMEGGVGANTISPHAHLTFEVRYTQVDERDRLLKAIKQIVNTSFVEGTKALLSGGIQRDVMEENESQLHLIKRMESLTNHPIKREKRGGVSDANLTASAGLTTLDGFGPFGDGDHSIHERALKKTFLVRIDLVTKFLTQHQKEIK